MTYDITLASLYLAVWIITLIWYQAKRNIWDAGSTIISSYILYAVFAVITLFDEFFSGSFEPLSLFPYIYLYGMLILALLPCYKIHRNVITNIEPSSSRTVLWVAVLIVIVSICLIPDIISNFGKGVVGLLTDADAGKEAYMEQSKEQEDAGTGISNIPSVIYNSLQDIAIFLFFYFLTQPKKHKSLTMLLGLSFAISIITPIMRGQRGGTILSLCTAIGAYMMFRQFLSHSINRVVKYIGLTVFLLISIPIAAITLSRFGDRSQGVMSYLYWYIGQGSLYFNNYGLDAGGVRYGERTCNLFLRLINPDTSKNYLERREKFHNLNIDDHLFTTFVGDFTIDFGPIIAFVIFVAFNFWVIKNVNPKDGIIKFHELFLVYFTMCICMQGGMALFSFSDTANLRIIAIMLFYGYLRYHELLVKKFPLVKTPKNE